MILEFAARGKKTFAIVMLALLYIETVLPMNALAAVKGGSAVSIIVSVPAAKAYGNLRPGKVILTPHHRINIQSDKKIDPPQPEDRGGPGQPETQTFTSVNGENMVDLFSGDFSYKIPLMDVGGYPIALGYNSGISMDQEPSWVGLGWNINPGSITRNMRGLPDEFNGADSISKVQHSKPSVSWGATLGAGFELFGTPSPTAREAGNDSAIGNLKFGVAFTYNNYRGYGIESSISPSLNAGSKLSDHGFTGALSLTNSSTDGLSLGSSLSYIYRGHDYEHKNSGASLTASVAGSYNTRAGLKDMQFSVGDRWYNKVKEKSTSGAFESGISFAHQAYTPTITFPTTGIAYSCNVKVGFEKYGYDPYVVAGYNHTRQELEGADTLLVLPAFGYLNYQNANGKPASLLDYNIEKEMSYREKPVIPTIGIPIYTYDVFSISGEGTGGMFRAYRSDIGHVHDHQMKTKSKSISGSLDLGLGQSVHLGVDFNLVNANTENGPWTDLNMMGDSTGFKSSKGLYEAAYFRNPGETAVNDKNWQKALGGDEVVATRLYQSGNSDPDIYAYNTLDRYRGFKVYDSVKVKGVSSGRAIRDKRTQIISFLTAEEAGTAGLSKYIDNYHENKFPLQSCDIAYTADLDFPGLSGDYYSGRNFNKYEFNRTDTIVNFGSYNEINLVPKGLNLMKSDFSIRWTGRLKIDVTGRYVFSTRTDDGIRLYINDSLVIDNWRGKPADFEDTAALNLVAGEMYNIKMEYFQKNEKAIARLQWRFAGQATHAIPKLNLYLPSKKDTFLVSPDNLITREKRVNSFRKSNHISEIDVLNADGRRYVYGIPVYNLLQKDLTFSVNPDGGNALTGLVKFENGKDNTTGNKSGNEQFFSKEVMPAYPHSFLLSGILSPDYVDLTGDGITSDDPGDAIRFNYTKIAGVKNPNRWRIPYSGYANYNQGLRTDNRDDKGSYLYGEKELWYLNSIESKNMIAIFWISNRKDLPGMEENGDFQAIGQFKRLDSIALYSKSDFQRSGTNALAIKTAHFDYDTSLCIGAGPDMTVGKLTLKKVWFTYNGNQRKDKNAYVFNYTTKNPSYKTNYYDRWGNYKDPSQNPGSAVNNIINNADYPYALQDSSLAAENAAAWTMNEITLPSGAVIKVDYESDDYAFVQNKRAAQMFRIAGFSASQPNAATVLNNELYRSANDYTYVGISVPYAVSSNRELYERYLQGMDTMFFKVFVKMPSDKFGSGSEYVTGYATMEPGNYGFYQKGSSFYIWLKLQTVNNAGEVVSDGYNPIAKAATQYLRLNLPSKAYPGSQTGDDLSPLDGAKMLLSQVTNLKEMFTGFDTDVRMKGWVKSFDTTRSYIRLANPYYKKYGGGLRVKRVAVYDNWNKMVNRKEAVYGQEYIYTTSRTIAGNTETISSGVASWEPNIGSEENPWKLPIQYKEQAAVLAPVSSGYVEKPLGETFFPAATVGYSKVRVRSLNTKKTRSANGYTENCFYTSYDFPTLTDMTPIADNKKRFKPTLGNLLKINAKHFMAISQGFKVELNDMNGKLKSQAYYNESDPDHPVSYTENYYHVDDQTATVKHLNNTVKVINDKGDIDPNASVGKDVEIMMSMRQQRSVTNAYNMNVNSDMFNWGTLPAIIPSLLNFAQREETILRLLGTTKVVNRHGLLDSVVVIDKGSRVVTKNLLYDGETGDVVLTSTQNEFNDSVFHFSVPAGWVYEGMSGAYKNIGAVAENVTISEGKVISGLDDLTLREYFSAGDEVLVYNRQKTGGTDCNPEIATWAGLSRIYVVDANAISGGTPDLYFVNKEGAAFTGSRVTMKVLRSGRRNMAAIAGEMAMLKNPVYKDSILVIDANSKVLNANAIEYSQFWKVADKKKTDSVKNCITQSYADYVTGEACGDHIYGNDSIGGWYSATCSGGMIGDLVYYHIDRDMYSSTLSQQAANDAAKKALDSLGPDYAARFSPCLYPNRAISRAYVKNNCQAGTIPDTTIYAVKYGKYRELSQQQADDLAAADTAANGQAYANANGNCLTCNFYVDMKPDTDEMPPFAIIATNDATGISYGIAGTEVLVPTNFPICRAIPEGNYTLHMKAMEICYAFTKDSAQHTLNNSTDETFVTRTPINVAVSMHKRFYSTQFTAEVIKNDCPSGLFGSTVLVDVPANSAYSYVSVADANAKARDYIESSLQKTANAQGTCLDGTHLIIKEKAGKGSAHSLLIYQKLGGTSHTLTFDGEQLTVPLDQGMWDITLITMSGTSNVSFNGGPTQTYGPGTGRTWHISGPPLTIEVWNP
ncbi:DUF5977 domain-containing protein [Chitinophaga sancti]|uniref:DUF5977 domain-containing protein n=1 Tax=Chitinophaga sancti TaxID=1004 RepID=A0A1K1SCU4_9BACT|nr:DUF5977 domain-containing protein [Chitinophaga sancti]WQD63582.1 DUF5977 domain-containing protein [Chitinophaga sancti]WQG90792.1 DUF5977 domain-containing protein [Chitinophaga sancti]SFW81855.1 PA14 domain-containing protein [Chitinophaga sancti]